MIVLFPFIMILVVYVSGSHSQTTTRCDDTRSKTEPNVKQFTSSDIKYIHLDIYALWQFYVLNL